MQLTISNQKPENKAQDFEFLKAEALRYVQKIAGKRWTDYNSHDPGVTIIEQLAYAINDLSFRTSFDIKDILAETGSKQEHFFTPREVLTSNPVSINDYRKILIDVEGIKNAWLEPKTADSFFSDGPTFYKDDSIQQLAFVESGDEENKVKLLGLYDILLEFEHDDTFGDLNNNKATTVLEAGSSSVLFGLKLEITNEYPYWDDPILKFPDTETVSQSQSETEVLFLQRPDQWIIKYDPETTHNFIVLDAITREERDDLAVELGELFQQSMDELSQKYLNKIARISDILQRVKQRIHCCRNLCEDFIEIRSLKTQEIALCLKIELEDNANADQVQAHIYHEINKFLSPQPEFVSLETLIEKGTPVDEIFEGPKLNNGFLQDDQLAITDRRKIIYTSDLINVIADVSGVTYLSELEIGKRENGVFRDVTEKEQWHLELDKDSDEVRWIPRLNITWTNIEFSRDGIPVTANRAKMLLILSDLEKEENAIIPDLLDFSVPIGESKGIGEYTSIQEDFPDTYGIGESGVAPTQPVARKASATQLKGYLMVFEQLITNYLAQLSNVGNLFSLDTAVDNTYFSSGLYDVPNAHKVLSPFLEKYNLEGKIDEIPEKQLDRLWSEFIEHSDNEYFEKLKKIAEQRKDHEKTFFDRRNRFLDHILARFGERFTDYSSIMYAMGRPVSGKILVEDKAKLLKDYPQASSERGRAFDYFNQQEGHFQYTGMELRIARLLGIDMINLLDQGSLTEKYQDQAGEYRFRIKDPTGEIILNSEEGYETMDELNRVVKHVLHAAAFDSNYQRRESRNKKYYFNLKADGGTEIIARSQEYFDTEEERDDEIKRVIEQLFKLDERVRLIEHILLRPRIKDRDTLLPIDQPEGEGGTCCPGRNDPYSFVVSIYLPSWPARFRNLDFRRYIEKKIRMETPAHIYPKICWISEEHMVALEDKIDAWKESLQLIDFNDTQLLGGQTFEHAASEALAASYETIPEKIKVNKTNLRRQAAFLRKKKKRGPKKLRKMFEVKIEVLEKIEKLMRRSDTTNELIKVMASVRNVYPEATLYDCHESERENPISLNQTVLGTFKPFENE